MTNQRYITMWRKTGENVLDWDFQVSENLDEVTRVVENIKKQGVLQYSTYPIGNKVFQHSCAF